jgi:hypothetical protein
MSSPSHEHLLGYVLGALEPYEHEQLERELASDPELARQAAALAARLQPLEHCRTTEPCRPGLASRTCNHVFDHVDDAAKVTPARGRFATAMAADYGHDANRWTLSDVVVAAGIFLAAGMLFFPAIANSRYQAQVAQCQNNLREIGEAFTRAQVSHPEVAYHNVLALPGNRSAAGVPVAMLHEQGFLDRANVVLCPGSPEAKERNEWRMPSLDEIDNASGAALAKLHRQAAGSLAFSLGYVPGGSSEHELDSDHFAIASDAPNGVVPQLLSTHHDGKGQNVLFASGRTAYVCGCGDKECGDSLFWNRDLKVEAGLDRSDIVLAPGGTRPFSQARLRLTND